MFELGKQSGTLGHHKDLCIGSELGQQKKVAGVIEEFK